MSTRSAILRNASANFALPAAALLTGPLLARALGVEGRGEVAAVLAALVMVSYLAPLGMQEALVYTLGRRLVSLRRAVRVSVEVALVSGAVAAGLLALLAPLLLRDAPEVVALLRAVTITLPLLVLGTCLRGMAQAQHRFGLTARERWVLGAGRIAIIVPLFLAGALTVTSAVWASALLPLVGALALLPALRRQGAAPAPADDALRSGRRLLLGYSSRSAPGTMLAVLGNRLDQLLIAPLAGVAPLGLYAVAASLAEIPLQGANAARDVVFATSSSRDDPSLVARAARLMVLVAAPVSLAGILLTPLVIPLLFGDDFAPAVPLAQILLLALVPQVVGAMFVSGLLGLGRPGLRSSVQVVVNVLLVVLLVVLIPAHGATGAAVAVLSSRVVGTAVFAVLFSRTSGLRLRECLLPRGADVGELWRTSTGLLRRRSARSVDPGA